ncbi:sugar ABC transporter substrate-binding protein [Gallibacterium genomosp. 2]|uniref:Sugar ABC transporter substrate-binding protein n=1 Tax=Gallibacterium genomosp. 2 TaxID=155517 RepID=A0A0A2YAU1_9PAST|nr:MULTISPECIES: sugar ABC transporter substrate-binding protein [Gallibacterium]KGQ34504.1 sugar ABC transporter substrate-binding protein [Gallibacterium genomosp. 2]KGQ44953.1 sugar ABC transporter substrate-binding protein [Gallibacterium anatis]
MKFKKLLTVAASVVFATLVLNGCKDEKSQTTNTNVSTEPSELAGDITMWHSFTQGPRLEIIQQAANDFMQKNPKVKIKIETFSWNDFYTKWTTGLASGNVPDLSTALPNQVVEMINVEALSPINDLIDDLGRDRFSTAAINEGTVGENNYSLPLYSHAQVMWIRKDLLEKNGLSVPKTWDELYQAAKALTKDGVYGLSVPMGTNDFIATRFLNLYVKSRGGSLLTKDLKVDLTSEIPQDGIKYWVKMYKETSPKDSINYNVLQQATLYYQGKTAFDFNSGFQIGGVQANTPQLLDFVDAYPVPKMDVNDPDYGLETANIPLVVWKHSKHPEVSKAFIKTLYDKDRYIKFLASVPVGMLPALKDIANEPAYRDNLMVKKFSHAEKVISDAVQTGTAIGYEYGPTVQGGLLTNQHIIEAMFQDIVVNGTDPMVAAKKAEDQLNTLFETVAQ